MKRFLPLNRWITRLWWIATLLLAFSLPFEVVTPWLTVSSFLVFTNIELVTVSVLVLWVARQIILRKFPTWHNPLTWSIGLLLLTLVLASFFAPGENLHALKVTARWFVGAAVFWMLISAVESGLPIGWLIRSMVLGGIIVAGATWGEVLFKQTLQPWLAPFRIGQEFQVGGELRPSSTLPFPTIAAMYLEVIFFLAISWLGLEWSRRRWTATGVVSFIFALVAGAVVLTLTRSALVALGLAGVLMLALRYRDAGFDLVSRLTAGGVGLTAVFLLVFALVNPTQQLRLQTSRDTEWYRAQFQIISIPTLYAGETVTATVRAQNVGLVNWQSGGENRVQLFYHWQSADGEQRVEPEGLRTELPHDLAPGESVQLLAQVRAPGRPGEYVLAWDMLREGKFWFSALGAPTYHIALRVAPPRYNTAADAVAPPAPPLSPVLRYLEVDRLTLWRTAGQMVAAHPLFGVGPGNFRLVLNDYLRQPVSDNLHANNTYVELFADAGIAGGLAFLFLTLTVLRLIWRGLRMAKESESSGHRRTNGSTPTFPARMFWLAGVAAAVAAFFIHGATDYFLEFTSCYLLFWSLLAYLVVLTAVNQADQIEQLA